MGLAVDTIAGSVTNQTTLTALTMASGDSLAVRNFPQATAKAFLYRVGRQSVTAGQLRILSPLLHDNTKGLTYSLGETPSIATFPREAFQQLQPQDTLVIQTFGSGAEVTAAYAAIYYTDLPGAAARLFSWADIKPRIKTIKALEVDMTTVIASSGWTDTLITATEDTTHANTDYAVLGYITDTAMCAIGIKGIDTGNMRIAGPGSLNSIITADYFVENSLRDGVPFIPVINSANKGATNVSTFAVAAVASKVTLNLAELYPA
jgi:hypothetical protein